MTYRITWTEGATGTAAGFLDDGPGLAHLFDVLDSLAVDPQPAESVAYGSPDTRRLRVGRYRALYVVDAAGDTDPGDGTITIVHIGRVP